MLSLVKKIYRRPDELLSLALILSLIRVDPDSYLGLGLGRLNRMRGGGFHNVTMGEAWAHTQIDFHRSILSDIPDIPYLHPKSMEASLAQYQEELMADLNELGRYTSVMPGSGDITAYLLNETNSINHDSTSSGTQGVTHVTASTSTLILGSTDNQQQIHTGISGELPSLQLSTSTGTLNIETGSSLSEEDADLIEILWKQDIDLGIPRDLFLTPPSEQVADLVEDLLKEKLNDKVNETKKIDDDLKKNESQPQNEKSDDDHWAGLAYTIAAETGEFIFFDDLPSGADSGCEGDAEASADCADSSAGSSDFSSLDKALGFVRFDSADFEEEKLTESNFTLGAFSPNPDGSGELVGSDDPLLASIAAPRQPVVRAQAAESVDRLLAEQESSLNEIDPLGEENFDLCIYLNQEEDLSKDRSGSASPTAGTSSEAESSIDLLSEELEASLEDMIQTAQMHPRSLQVRMPLMRTMSMEHRWQDLANFLSLPDGHGSNLSSHHTAHHHHGHPHAGHPHSHGHHPLTGHPALSSPHSHPFAHPYPHPHSTSGHGGHPSIPHNPHTAYGVHSAAAAAAAAAAAVGHQYGGLPTTATPVAAYSTSADTTGRAALLQNASLGSTSLTELGTSGNGTYPTASMGSGVTLGSAVTASMNLTNSTDPLETSGQVTYKTESAPDMQQLYYQNNTSEVNTTGDGFFPSIFNEDDLQLMDMAMTDTMYPTRLLEGQPVAHGIVLPNSVNPSGATVQPGVSSVIDTTSDSAVSSMGSERVPSISDGDWIDSNVTDTNSTAGATAVVPSTSAYSMDYATGAKYRHYEYGYNGRQGGSGGVNGSASGVVGDGSAARGGSAPVAQKKHHMFGKRVFHDQNEMAGSPVAIASPSQGHKFDYNSSGGAGSMYSHPSTPLDGASSLHSMDMKYGCPMDYNHHPHEVRGAMDHMHHNHTYAIAPEASGPSQRPISRDKHRASSSGLRGSVSDTSIGAGTSGSSSESEAYSRDEKRARAMNIPMTVDDIINLPMDEFNERLSKYDLTEAQLSLIRDIRRRGKNKVAAQNCRKRKLDQILTLADEVKRVRERKIRLHKEREFLMTEKARIKDRFAQLYRHVFQSLRDADGQPYSPYEYSLQQSADGNILLVPRAATHNSAPIDPQPSTVRPILDPSGSGMSNAGVNSNANMNVSGSATGEHHGARRKNPDHKNEP